MKEITGNLIRQATEFDIIVHGCNCFSTMGAGIAKQIKVIFPEAFNVDKNDPRTPQQKLGGISYTTNTTPIIINAYTQFHFKGKNNVDYDAIKSAFKEIKLLFTGKKFGIPLIGAGLAGGDWKLISSIIEKEMIGEDITVVIFEEDQSLIFDKNTDDRLSMGTISIEEIINEGLTNLEWDGIADRKFFIKKNLLKDNSGKYLNVSIKLKFHDVEMGVCVIETLDELKHFYEITSRKKFSDLKNTNVTKDNIDNILSDFKI